MDILSCWPGLDMKVIEELPQFAFARMSLEMESLEDTSMLFAEDLHCDWSICKTVFDCLNINIIKYIYFTLYIIL